MGSIWWTRVRIVAGALVALGFAARTYSAISSGHLFIGRIHWVTTIGTVLMIPILVVGIPVGLWWSIRNWRK